MYISSSAFISPQTVVPALLARIGGTNVEIGMLGVLTYVGYYIPQLFAARYVETVPWKKPWAITFGTAQRFMMLLMGLLILFFGANGSSATLWIFLFFYFSNSLIAGITTPGWFDLFAKLTSAKKRGRLVGIRNSLGGIGAFLGGFVLTWLLAVFMFPVNYASGSSSHSPSRSPPSSCRDVSLKPSRVPSLRTVNLVRICVNSRHS